MGLGFEIIYKKPFSLIESYSLLFITQIHPRETLKVQEIFGKGF